MRVLTACALMLVFLAGCETKVPSTAENAPAPDSVPAKTAKSLTPEKVSLVQGDQHTLERMIAAHKGSVVFVDYWATWCHPCVEYFPHTVEMHRNYKDQALVVIAVSFDDLEEEAKARAYLADQGADFENLISNLGQGPAAFEGFGIENVPHFRLYDRNGKLVQKWDEEPVDLEEKIKAALAAESTTEAGGE
jgi:thiol-disulfide isomerase/thioredoxin